MTQSLLVVIAHSKHLPRDVLTAFTLALKDPSPTAAKLGAHRSAPASGSLHVTGRCRQRHGSLVNVDNGREYDGRWDVYYALLSTLINILQFPNKESKIGTSLVIQRLKL